MPLRLGGESCWHQTAGAVICFYLLHDKQFLLGTNDWQTISQTYSDLGIWWTLTQKWMKGICLVKQNHESFFFFFFFFLQMMNFELSNKIRIPKSGIVLHKLDSFLYLTTLLMMSLVVMLTNVIFLYYTIKYVNIWKICIPQWDHYFPNDWGTVTKSCIGKKDPFKV